MHQITLSLAFLAAAGLAAAEDVSTAHSMLKAVQALQAELNDELRAGMTIPFADEQRIAWSFFPGERQGLKLKDLNEAQQELFFNVVRAGLSASGFKTAEIIRHLDAVLREMGGGPERDPELYCLTVYGTPSAEEPWGLRYEGHHLSLNWTIAGGKVIASTPQFLGANPAEVRSGSQQGTRALAPYEDLAREIVKSLSDDQRAAAVISDTAPADILTRMDREAAIQEDKGVAFSALDEKQQGMLISLIEGYAHVQAPALAEERLKKVRDGGLDTVKFAWMGGLEPGEGHYYRVQGPGFLIEYDNTQNNANHIHTVWRDFKGDFGRDVLKEHYQAHAAGDGHGHDH